MLLLFFFTAGELVLIVAVDAAVCVLSAGCKLCEHILVEVIEKLVVVVDVLVSTLALPLLTDIYSIFREI